ncbi:MAG: hypothetical protein LUD15_15080 [Bacteroides sp.]|nr:hypothetical protein [Bacteroides sp.]
MLEAVSAGNKVMLVSNNLPFQLEDTLRTEVSMPYLYLHDLPCRVTEGMKKDTLSLSGRDFYFYEAFTGATLRPRQKRISPQEETIPKEKSLFPFPTDTLVTNPLNQPIAQHYHIGKGELYLVCNPLLFTNYGMLDGKNTAYIFTLLEPLKEFPLIRLERSSRSAEQLSPLRYILSQPPLRYSYYLALATLLLFMIFTARRKQRIIPVITSPLQ